MNMQIHKVGQGSSNFIRYERKKQSKKKNKAIAEMSFFFAKWGSLAQWQLEHDPLDKCHFLLCLHEDSSQPITEPRWQSSN